MTKRDRTTPPAADPHAGRNPGYAETRPRDRRDVTRPAPKPAPSPDEPGMTRDPNPDPDPAPESDTGKSADHEARPPAGFVLVR